MPQAVEVDFYYNKMFIRVASFFFFFWGRRLWEYLLCRTRATVSAIFVSPVITNVSFWICKTWGMQFSYFTWWVTAKITTKVLLLKAWYFGHTGWSHFQTDQSTMLNRHLIQNEVKFQFSVFIFLNRGFHAFVLTKFPLSLFNTLSCP